MTDLFGGYKSQETRSLARIDSSKYPDTNKDFESNVRRLNDFVDYISQYLQQMQKGVDSANKDPITRMRDMISDMVVLLSGGELLYGINLGDLQYFLPAIGALLGFDSDQPFPLNLFYAAEHFLLGYIVPLDSFTSVIGDIIDGWAEALGIDADFIDALHQLLDAVQGITNDFLGLFNSIADLFSIFGLGSDGSGFGIFGDLWHSVSMLFGGFDIQTLGDITDPIFHTLAPWVKIVAQFIDWLDQIVKGFSGGISSLEGVMNFISMFSPLNFMSGNSTEGLWGQLASFVLLPFNILLGPNSLLNAFNIFGFLNPGNIPFIPVGHIGQDQPELLGEAAFGDPESIAAGGAGWTWDGTIGRTALGSAKATANGTNRMLVSDPIYVSQDQALTISTWLIWANAAFSGSNHASLSINTYSGINFSDYIGTTNIANQTLIGANQPTWQQLSGQYTVPAGVTYLRFALRINNNITAGNVWFDDASCKKTGQIQQSWVSGLLDSLGGLGDFIENVIRAILNGISIFPIFGLPIATLIDNLLGGITEWSNDTDATAAQASDAYIGLQATQDIVVNSTAGSNVSSVSDADVQAALNAQTAAIAAQAAAIAAIQAQNTAQNNSGVAVTETFEYNAPAGLPPELWHTSRLEGDSSDGTIAVVNGHDAGWHGGDNVGRSTILERYIGINNHSMSSYQSNSAVIAALPQPPGWFDSRVSEFHSYALISDDETKWVRAAFLSSGFIRFDYHNGGASGQLGDIQPMTVSPSASSPIGIVSGTTGGPNVFQALINGKPQHTVTDVGNVVDLTPRGHGWGQTIVDGLLPGLIGHYSSTDNAPAPTVGVGCRIFRANTAAIAKNTGQLPFTAGTFDTIERITPNLSWDGEAVTITVDGWYSLDICITNNFNQQTGQGAVLLYKKTAGPTYTLYAKGQNWGVREFGSNSLKCYLQAGDVVVPGLDTPFETFGIIGDASAFKSFFTLVLLNRSLA